MNKIVRIIVAGVCLLFLPCNREALAFPADSKTIFPQPDNLLVDGNMNPLATLDNNPLLSWRLADSRPGSRQETYRVIVASNAETLAKDTGDLWDSGMVESAIQSVRYAGKPVPAGGTAWWKVMYRDPAHGESPWSKVVRWEPGLQKEDDWGEAAWITGFGEFDERQNIPASSVGMWMWYPETPKEDQTVSFVGEIHIPANTLAIKADLVVVTRSRDAWTDRATVLDEKGNSYLIGQSGTRNPFQSGMSDISYALGSGKHYLVIESQASGEDPAVAVGLAIELSNGKDIVIMSDSSWKCFPGKFMSVAQSDRLTGVALHGKYGDKPTDIRKYLRAQPMNAPLLRKVFTLPKEVKKARAYVAALGFSELYINGSRVGDEVLDPAQSNYEMYSLYVSHDVTDMVRAGRNALGIMLGDGWYGQNQWLWNFGAGNMHYGKPSVRAALVVEYVDGTSEEIITDNTWKTADGPVTENNIWAGEQFDAREIKEGWSTSEYDDRDWKPAMVLHPDIPALRLCPVLPIRPSTTIQAQAIHEPVKGVYVIDFGQNIAGWVRMSVREKKGTRIRLRFAENLNPDKTLNFQSVGVHMHGVLPADEYIASGSGPETWEPRFTYHSFRYAEVHGLSVKPAKEDFLAVPVHTALENRGTFECSDPLINRIHRMSRWTLLNNMHGKQTDCPGRERDEWNADAQVSAEFAIYNFNMLRMYNKLVDNIASSPGMIRNGIPGEVAVGKRGQNLSDVGWGTALIAIPWYLYVYYGDTSAAERHWQKMAAFVEWIGSVSENHIPSRMKWSDHAPPRMNIDGSNIEPCDQFALGMIHYCYSAQKMATLAEAIDRPVEVEKYRKLAAEISNAFSEQFMDKNTLSHGHQTIDAMALKYDMVPAEFRAGVAASLDRDVRSRNYGVIGGIYGYQPIFEELLKAGYLETAWRAMRSISVPGVPYSIEKGDATTIWEAFWPENDRRFMGVSHNHPMFGSIDAVYYAYIAGIRPDPAHPGFQRFILKPAFTAYLPSAKAEHETLFGLILSDWNHADEVFAWHITVPPGTVAEAHVPGTDKSKLEWTMPCGTDPKRYAVYERSDDNCLVFKLVSGTYHLRAPYDAAKHTGITDF